jgi:hypothetical protein
MDQATLASSFFFGMFIFLHSALPLPLPLLFKALLLGQKDCVFFSAGI